MKSNKIKISILVYNIQLKISPVFRCSQSEISTNGGSHDNGKNGEANQDHDLLLLSVTNPQKNLLSITNNNFIFNSTFFSNLYSKY